MKRKIIKQGRNTLTLTLPKFWTEKLGLKSGDEIDMEVRDNLLVVKGKQLGELTKKTIHSKDMNYRVLEGSLISCYKVGYDEIEIIFDDPKTIKIVQNIVKEKFMGFEIIEQSNKRCLIKNLLMEQESEFDTLVRKIFLAVNTLSETAYQMIKENKYTELPELEVLDQTSNKCIYMCHRMLFRNGFREYKKTIPIYIILFHYDRISHEYLGICKYMADPKNKSLVLGKETLALFKRCNDMYMNYYHTFYKFDLEKLKEISDEMYAIENEVFKLLQKRPPLERPVLGYFIKLTQFMNNILSSRLALELC